MQIFSYEEGFANGRKTGFVLVKETRRCFTDFFPTGK
jgi:hypothetical protein